MGTMLKRSAENLYKNLPDSPGAYLMKDKSGRVLYVGKAGNLKRRVSSYFLRPQDYRIEKMTQSVRYIGYQKTDTALEALILESRLIKKLAPPFNVREKDDKSFLYVEFTKEKFPRVLLIRGKEIKNEGKKEYFGPFTSASSIRQALRILRKIFPYSTHPPEQLKKRKRPCFDAQIGLCPGVCAGTVLREDYLKNIRSIKLIFEGKKKRIISDLKRDMAAASRNLEFEKAAAIRRRLFALGHIQDVALIAEKNDASGNEAGKRIEGYDISNISGISAVGSMVAFVGNKPDKNWYRRFKIRTIKQADDVGMLKEVLRRRFKNDWPLPDLVLVDGGKPQVNAARRVLDEAALKLPVIGIAKGPERKKNEIVGRLPDGYSIETLVKVRDEAHRFAIGYHKKLRSRNFLSGLEG